MDAYHPVSNPEGVIQLGLAENQVLLLCFGSMVSCDFGILLGI